MADFGLTHIALPASNIPRSIAFYSKYARMQVVHRRADGESGSDVVWLSDRTRPFVVVLIGVALVEHPLLPWAHLGVGCESREEVARLCREAQAEGLLIDGPTDSGYPVGYWALISDPDGHTLEISYGQEVALTLEQTPREAPDGEIKR
jgi:catechol 2,3-dioxygenase-like lactoylglutathione lyase family enzyme